MRAFLLFLIALSLSGSLAYYVEMEVKLKSPYSYIGPYDVYPSGATVNTVYNGYNITGSPTSAYFMFTSSSCNDCFDCGLANHYVLQAGHSILNFGYFADYVKLSGSELKTVCFDTCNSTTGASLTIGYDIPWYYTMNAVVYKLTFRN